MSFGVDEEINKVAVELPNSSTSTASAATASSSSLNSNDIKQQQIENYRHGKGLMLNMHPVHHAGMCHHLPSFVYLSHSIGSVPCHVHGVNAFSFVIVVCVCLSVYLSSSCVPLFLYAVLTHIHTQLYSFPRFYDTTFYTLFTVYRYNFLWYNRKEWYQW